MSDVLEEVRAKLISYRLGEVRSWLAWDEDISRLITALAQAREELAREQEVIARWFDARVNDCNADSGRLDGYALAQVCGMRDAFRECAEFVRNRSKGGGDE